jgi:hypothetical protein
MRLSSWTRGFIHKKREIFIYTRRHDMRLSLFVLACLFPMGALAQNDPSSLPTSAPVVMSPVETPQIAPDIQARSQQAFLYSLYPTLGGFAGAIAFNSMGRILLSNGSLGASRAFLGLGGASSILALVGPSIGHYWAGDSERGTSLLLRRFFIPLGIAVVGTVVFFEGGVRVVETDGAQGAGLVGTGILIIVGAGAFSIVQTVMHVVDARQAPVRVAKRRGEISQLMLAPTPIANIGTGKLMPGLSLSLNF